ncbi:MAG TPA: multidrug effflux MFS transporter [Burkholderiaceae bacterium]|nr:multidrug effflux MFS transporter [Burkholderiaceae bacterium]
MTAATPPRATPAIGIAGSAWLIGTLLALQPLCTDLYLPTLPSMAREFGGGGGSGGVGTVQWTLSVFIGTFGLVQLIAGPLSDRFGRRPLIVGGAALYTAGSLVCLLAPAIATMIAGRALQAAGACTCVVAARAVVRDLYEPQHGARTLAAAGTIMGFAPMLGPLAGAALNVTVGWRAVFAFLTVVGTVVVAFTAWRLAETNRHRDPAALQGARLAGTYAEVGRSATFRAYALANTASYAGLFAFLSASSFVLIRVMGLSPFAYAGGLALNGASYMMGTIICRRLMAETDLVDTLRAGALMQVLAGAAMVVVVTLAGATHLGPLAILLSQCLYSAGHGIVQPVAQAGCVGPFPRAAGAAAALMGFMIQVSAAAVGMVVGATWNGTPYPMAMLVAAGGAASWTIGATLVRRRGRIR